MDNEINLSKRLTGVASFITGGLTFADIGSDHAHLPCYVCKTDLSTRAIAGELNEGPYLTARATVKAFDLEDRIEVRQGDGLHVLYENEADLIVIAGMGGALIKTILEEGKSRLNSVKRIIAQPNVDERQVRKWFVRNNYTITHESILEESGHIYEIIVADRQTAHFQQNLTAQELLFGPLLLKEKSPVFQKKWQNQLTKRIRTINQMKSAKNVDTDKVAEFEKEVKWIKEVLHHDS